MSRARKPQRVEQRKERNEEAVTKRSQKPRSTRNYEKKGFKEGLKEQEEKQDYNNRVSMYFSEKDRALLDQVSSFSMNQFLEEDGTPFVESELSEAHIPAVMILYYNPSCGFTRGVSPSDSGINIAGMKVYNKSSSMNAKTTQYQPQDDSTLLLALGDVVGHFAHIRRFFQLAFLYNKRNWNVPRYLMEQMGLDVDDFFKNLGDYRLQFNTVVNMVNQISFPGDLEWFSKCQEMYSHIYKDSESPMAQLYAFVPATYWQIDETAYEEGTILKTVAGELLIDGTKRGPQTMGAKLLELKAQIQAILDSSTFNYIYADVLRLCNPSELLTMPYVVEGEAIEPEFDPMMMVQLNNAVALGMPNGSLGTNTTPSNDVYPVVSNNTLKYAPQFPAVSALGTKHAIVNFPHSMGDPDVDQRVEATRQINCLVMADGITMDAALADHYLVGFSIPQTAIAAVNAAIWKTSGQISGGSVNWIELLAALSKFDYCPRILNVDASGNVVNIQGDIDFFTTINFAYLKKVNDLAYTHLFEIPAILDK